MRKKTFYLAALGLSFFTLACAGVTDAGEGDRSTNGDTRKSEESKRDDDLSSSFRRQSLKDMMKASSLPQLVLGRRPATPGEEGTADDERKSQERESQEGGDGKKWEEEEEEPSSWQFLSASRGGGKGEGEEDQSEESGQSRGFQKVAERDRHYSVDSSRHRPKRRRPDVSRPPSRRHRVAGFSLVRACNESVSGRKGKIEFENVFTDLNSMWNPRAKVFVCKEPGLYFFSFNGRGKGSDHEGEDEEPKEMGWLVSLMLNGVEVVSMGGESWGPGAAAVASSNSVLLALNPRDEVWLELMEGRLEEFDEDESSSSFGGGHRSGVTTFSGYRVGDIDWRDISDQDDVDDEGDDEKEDDRRQEWRGNKMPDRHDEEALEYSVDLGIDGDRHHHHHHDRRRNPGRPEEPLHGDRDGLVDGGVRRRHPPVRDRFSGDAYVIRDRHGDDRPWHNDRTEYGFKNRIGATGYHHRHPSSSSSSFDRPLIASPPNRRRHHGEPKRFGQWYPSSSSADLLRVQSRPSEVIQYYPSTWMDRVGFRETLLMQQPERRTRPMGDGSGRFGFVSLRAASDRQAKGGGFEYVMPEEEGQESQHEKEEEEREEETATTDEE